MSPKKNEKTHNPDTWLGKIRQEADLSQQEMAALFGVSRESYVRMEKEVEPRYWYGRVLDRLIHSIGARKFIKILREDK